METGFRGPRPAGSLPSLRPPAPDAQDTAPLSHLLSSQALLPGAREALGWTRAGGGARARRGRHGEPAWLADTTSCRESQQKSWETWSARGLSWAVPGLGQELDGALPSQAPSPPLHPSGRGGGSWRRGSPCGLSGGGSALSAQNTVNQS